MKPLPLPLVCVVWDDARGQGDGGPIDTAGARASLAVDRHTYGLLLRDDREKTDMPMRDRLVVLAHDFDPPHDCDNLTTMRADWVNEIVVLRQPPKKRGKRVAAA